MTSVATRSRAWTIVKRYAILAYGAVGTMLDVGLMVVGSVLVGLGASVLLSGLELVNVIPEDLSTAAMLASALVLTVIGLFCLGLAAEGPVGRGRRLIGFRLWEIGIGRALAVVGVGAMTVLAYRFGSDLIGDLPQPLHQGVDALRAVGIAGMTVMPLVGVPLSLLLRWARQKWSRIPDLDIPIMFVVWAAAVMVILF